jgi:hypothetical protein
MPRRPASICMATVAFSADSAMALSRAWRLLSSLRSFWFGGREKSTVILGKPFPRFHLPVSAGCCMPFRCGVSAMLTLAAVRSAWRRQSAHGHLRPMSRMVTVGREVVREIRRSAWQLVQTKSPEIRAELGVMCRAWSCGSSLLSPAPQLPRNRLTRRRALTECVPKLNSELAHPLSACQFTA